ncbi:phosphatidate cytidylyltransferase [Parachitinimonas caeni]|uniref:Phosphatidate cytidylyltransferase n=1 Tax=Parachitinimonas caeni TaxID=3031301 RepID=A0ABT7DX33_9NEIS|nr:phosphatidate cytidylyltransferase [Parachitinimonas caeni]MDK2124620.1 phosphatidate cytidylyltransferase [Parachitinimonas caeni]
MLKTRIITALVLLPLVLLALFALPAQGWGAFTVLVIGLAAWEWTKLAKLQGPEAGVFILASVVQSAALAFLPGATAAHLLLDPLALLFWCAIAPLWLVRKWTLAPRWLAALIGWLILMAATASLLRWHALPNGAMVMLALFAIAWVADTAAYFSGRKFGRHKLAPSISPGKTWEGVFGGLIAVTVYLLVLRGIGFAPFSVLPLYVLLPVGWVLTAVSVVGDLLESLFKRQVGLKDSSGLLPGHGGILDRVDSLLALLPVVSALKFTIFAAW